MLLVKTVTQVTRLYCYPQWPQSNTVVVSQVVNSQSNQQGERERDRKVERKWKRETNKMGKQSGYGDLI